MKTRTYLQTLCLSVAATGLVGCGEKGSSFSLLPDSQSFVQDSSSVNNELDILFVINDQPSMSSFQDELVTSFTSFMSLFNTKGFDYKIAVVTTAAYMADPTLSGYSSFNADEDAFNDFNGTTHSGVFVIQPTTLDLLNVFSINAKPSKNTAGQDGRAFSSFRRALQTTNPVNIGFLRPNSFLAVVIVDNQDDFSGNGRCAGCNMNQRYNAPTLDPVGDYVQFLDQLTNTSGATARYNVSAMTQIAQPCQGGTNMTRIMELANQTNGVLGNICDADFGPAMADMASHIATLGSQFYLDRVPVESSIVVHVDGLLVSMDPVNGWTYSSTANSIQFHGTAVPQKGAVISVNFDPVSYGS